MIILKQNYKKIVYILLAIVLIWILLIVVESTRFKTSRDFSEKPIITIKNIETENLQIYKGLGYTVQYNINDDKSIYGVSFLLFDKFMLWAWVT